MENVLESRHLKVKGVWIWVCCLTGDELCIEDLEWQKRGSFSEFYLYVSDQFMWIEYHLLEILFLFAVNNNIDR